MIIKKIKNKLKNLSKTSYTFRAIYNNLKAMKRKISYIRKYKKIKVNDKMIMFKNMRICIKKDNYISI